MTDTTLIDQAVLALKGASRVLVLTHEKPDGDAIASLVAFGYISQYLGIKSSHFVCKDLVPQAFSFLPNIDKIANDFLGGDVDVIVILDCGDFKRTGFAARLSTLARRAVIINIDHHPKNDLHRMATINIVDPDAASTTQILDTMCQHLNILYSPELSTALFTGLYTDTGSFQHPVTTPKVLEIASRLLTKGARLKQVHHNLVMAKPVAMLRLWGVALERVRLTRRGIAVSVITQQDLEATGAAEEDLAGIVGLLEATHHCKVAVLLAETADGMIKGSLRSNNSSVDVSRVAQLFGGGGHARAAGFMVAGRILMDKSGWTVV